MVWGSRCSFLRNGYRFKAQGGGWGRKGLKLPEKQRMAYVWFTYGLRMANVHTLRLARPYAANQAAQPVRAA